MTGVLSIFWYVLFCSENKYVVSEPRPNPGSDNDSVVGRVLNQRASWPDINLTIRTLLYMAAPVDVAHDTWTTPEAQARM